MFSYLCFCDKVRNFSRSENSTVEVCTQKGGQGPLIGATPDTMHNSELCTNQRALHSMLLPHFSDFCDLDFLLSDWCKMRYCSGTGDLHQSEGVARNVAA